MVIVALDYRLRIAAKMLFRRKGSLFAATMAVAIAILVIAINSVIFNGVANAIIRDLTDYRFGHVLITDRDGNIQRSDREMIGFLKNMGSVEGATVRLVEVASINNTRTSVPVRAYGVPLIGVIPEREADATRLRETVVEGTFLTSRDSIVLGKSVADDLGARVGDPVKVKVTGRQGAAVVERFTVAGISGTAGGLGFDTSAVVDIDTLREMTGRQGESSQLIVRLFDVEDSAQVAQDFLSRYPGERLEAETIEEAGSGILEGIRSGIAFINLVGYFGLLSASFAIVTIMILTVSSKTRDIGIMKAMGIRRRDIMAIFVVQGLVIGSIAAAACFAIGTLLALYLQSAGFSFGGGLELEVTYDPAFTLSSSLFAIALGAASSLYPAYRASRLEPVDAMRHS